MTYEQSITRKDQVIANITRAIQKQVPQGFYYLGLGMTFVHVLAVDFVPFSYNTGVCRIRTLLLWSVVC